MASGHVRLALCDNTWWFAKLKRGYRYGQDTAEDRPPRSPESYQGAWYFAGTLLMRRGKLFVEVWRMYADAQGSFDSYRCCYKPYWEPISKSRTARRIAAYLREHPDYIFPKGA